MPDKTPFVPDSFQLEAVELVQNDDVLVSAPTGSGKTWIAVQAIESCLARGLSVWYASPLKALSNSIYQEFVQKFGPSQCGILTGDRKENADASVIVGTTEILRNQLYDAMHKGVSIGTDLVILDEAHYLTDPDRGVVWEEVLIYLPSRVRLLLLSATISNPEEVCAWLKQVRGVSNRVVLSEERPVPLKTLFLFPDGLVTALGSKKGLGPKVKKFLSSKEGQGGRRSEKIDYGNILACLRKLDLLPAIFFLKSRADCDHALSTCSAVPKPPGLQRRMKGLVKAFVKEYPHIEGHRQIKPLLESLVGSHHGGQLPYWKVLIEQMMNKGLLEAIFSTSTVAAGVNFPARSVVLFQSDRYNGREFADLTPTALHQMVGRAGRRGMDNIGFALVVPGYYQNPKLIHELLSSPPDPILSQIHINFSMTLNLLLSHTPFEVKDLLERSLAAFQEKARGGADEKWLKEQLSGFKGALPKAQCDASDPYEVLEHIHKTARTKGVRSKSPKAAEYGRRVRESFPYLTPGRLFLHKNGNLYVVFKAYMDEERLICAAHNIRKKDKGSRRQLTLRRVDLAQIEIIYDLLIQLPDDYSRDGLDRLFEGVSKKDLQVLNIENGETEPDKDSEAQNDKQDKTPCEDCAHLDLCHGKTDRHFNRLLTLFRNSRDRLEASESGLWLSFKQHLRFLKETGFVDMEDRLTEDGRWACNLRVDQPLLIAESIRQGAFDDISPEVFAGGMAPFVWDRSQEVDLRGTGGMDLTPVEGLFHKMLGHLREFIALKESRGFKSPSISFWPSAILFMWAKGATWETLSEVVSVGEGDLASLIMRTADHLRQVAALRETHPDLAHTAGESIAMILREPVYLF
ncbi:MAG: DEAD/DEAH box helicase [Deltaproteobacteria bacterium]|nr:DEAD/DEAH box helicase [Deltaproteobacteria bacterium]